MTSHHFKTLLERLMLNKAWLEPASDLRELSDFLRAVRPVATSVPLVRVGAAGDGGYLVPDDFEGLTTCVSPGVATEVSFDLEMAHRGLEVYMTDASVEAPPLTHERFHFSKKFLEVYEDEVSIRLDTFCDNIPDNGSSSRVLQMDIEGAEYRVLLDTSDETLTSFRMILVEFHHLTRLFGRFSAEIIKATFYKLLRHFYVVHIHPNNVCSPTTRGDISIPPVMEFTFLRKDRARVLGDAQLEYPHPFDQENIPDRPPVLLPECWWRQRPGL